MRRPLILALSLLGLARLASTKPQPGLDVESVADKIIKKIGENFNLFLDDFGTSIVLGNLIINSCMCVCVSVTC